MLGTWLRRTAPPGIEVVPLVHRTRTGDPRELVADLREPVATAEAFRWARPDLAIHAAYAKDEAQISLREVADKPGVGTEVLTPMR